MQESKDAFGIEVDDDDPWYKEHPGEYKVVGYSPIGEELYYRPGMNDDDDDDERDRPAYTSHSSGGTYYETPQMRKARHKFYIKIALGIIAGLFALWVVIGFVSNITHTNHEKNTANESITTSLTQIDDMNNFAKTLLDNPALTAPADPNTINGVADAQNTMNETANKAKTALNSDDHDTLTTNAQKLRASIIALTRNLNMAYASIANNTANATNDATLKAALEQAKTTLDNQPIAAMYNNNRDYLTGLWNVIGDAVTQGSDAASLANTINECTDHL